MKTCAADDCHNPLDTTPGRRGRPPIYCSPACRPSRQRTSRVLLVEVDIGADANDDGNGLNWLVRLRRGRRGVVVRDGLGRFAAFQLAEQLYNFLTPRRARQTGGAID